MFKLNMWLNLAAVVCVAWGILGGYRTYEREINRAHGQMHIRFNACAGRVYETHAYEAHRLQLLTLECSETLDDDRWVPVLAPNLSRDTAIAGFGPILLALGLACLPFLAAPWFRAARVAKPTPIVR